MLTFANFSLTQYIKLSYLFSWYVNLQNYFTQNSREERQIIYPVVYEPNHESFEPQTLHWQPT